MAISDIVNVSISPGTAFPSQRGFGTPLLLAFHTRFPENSRLYSSLRGMTDDGFTVDDPAYRMAQALLSQNPRPDRFRIGRLPAPASAHTTRLDCSGAVAGDTIAMTVTNAAGASVDVSVDYATSATATATAVASAIDALADVSATASTGVVTVVADSNGPMVFFSSVSGPCEVYDTTADWAYDTQLGVILNESSDFYAVAIDVNSDANIADVAAWVNSNDRIAGFGPQSTDPADYNTQGNALRTGDNDRVFSIVKQTSRALFPECAAFGRCLPKDPGSQTWAFKSLSGVTPDGWSTSQISTIEAQNSNHYTEVAGLSILRQGKMHGGEFIDVTRGLDWLTSRIQERILALLANNDKIPFTDSGIQLVKAAVEEILRSAVIAGVLEGGTDPVTGESLDPFVTAPRAAAVPAADRAERHLTGLEFQGRLAGAIHKVTIRGTVSI